LHVLPVILDNAACGIHVIQRIAVDYAAIEHRGLVEILSDNSCLAIILMGLCGS
jgi:hypothetical protein